MNANSQRPWGLLPVVRPIVSVNVVHGHANNYDVTNLCFTLV